MTLGYGSNEKIEVVKGEVVLIPAIFDRVMIYPDKRVKFLEVFIA